MFLVSLSEISVTSFAPSLNSPFSICSTHLTLFSRASHGIHNAITFSKHCLNFPLRRLESSRNRVSVSEISASFALPLLDFHTDSQFLLWSFFSIPSSGILSFSPRRLWSFPFLTPIPGLHTTLRSLVQSLSALKFHQAFLFFLSEFVRNDFFNGFHRALFIASIYFHDNSRTFLCPK